MKKTTKPQQKNVYFKISSHFSTLIHYTNVCKRVFTDKNGKVTTDCCEILVRSSVAFCYNTFVSSIYNSFEIGRICACTSEGEVTRFLGNPGGISGLKKRKIILFLVSSFRIVFR